MKFKYLAVATLLAVAGGAAPAEAQLHFYNICSPGSFRVCASADVMVGQDNTLIINVWNLNETEVGTNGLPTDLESYYTRKGGWHTITAIGLTNVGYTLPYRPEAGVVDASLFDGFSYSTLPKWLGTADATSLQITNTGADIEDHRQGIVGCFDPGPEGSEHAGTCSSYPYAPYVQFTLKGYGELDLSQAQFMFQSQQVAYESCDPSNWNSDDCLGNVMTASGGSTEVVPEPITLILVGSGLVGVGAARRRKRRGLVETV